MTERSTMALRNARPTAAARRGRVRIGLGNALYISSQFLPAVTGPVLMLLIGWQALRSLLLPKGSARGPSSQSVGNLSPFASCVVISTLIALVLLQSALLPHDLRPTTAVHLLIYLLAVFASRKPRQVWPSIAVIRVVIWTNGILLLSFFVDGVREIFWYENLGQYRYRAFYFEPSIAALIYVFNIQIIWSFARHHSDFPLLISISLVSLLLTYSGSGFLLLALMILSGIDWRRLIPLLKGLAFAIPPLLLFSMTERGSDAIDELIVRRLAGILALEYDNSIHLRAVAPFLFLGDQMQSGIYAWIGFGIGGIENYISGNESNLIYLSNFAGEIMTTINNGYVVLASLVGIPIALILVLWFVRRLFIASMPRGLKVYVALYPFVSGFVIHPLFWLLLAIVMYSSPVKRSAVLRVGLVDENRDR